MSGVRFTEDQSTNLATLYGRALDARAAHPVLGDPTAEDAVRRIDYDFGKFKIGRAEAFGIACRGKVFDQAVREFVAAHEESTVLHLGAGMDSRVFRIDPPPTVRWYDVDFPDVIDLRAQVYPERANTTVLRASVTAPGWLDQVPADRPTLVVAEGLTMYLDPEGGFELFRRVVERFPSGEVFIDAYSKLGIRLQKTNSVVRRAKATLRWGIDPEDLEEVGLTLSAATNAAGFVPEEDWQYLPAVQRVLYRAMLRIPVLRDMGRTLRYRFGS
ncbi:class I SAM-dependent methyltransferase [Actinophytocola sp. NPDC049390]|uniref:class I SAM-dependent methyltransferase n=1 Tax=Actinophytocola sp. NPDC049390 TaxID=3363894 RepID=UPI0037A41C6F